MAEEQTAKPPVKCPECVPGLPGWMATFSDLVTLLLTFFVLLLSFAKTETNKYEAALGSIRNAFGGNVLKHGEVIQRGKSPDDSPSMLESQEPVRSFPIDFLTMEGLLDKHEVNRESGENLAKMKRDLYDFELTESANIYELPEGIRVNIKDKILFKKGNVEISNVTVEVFERLVKMLSKNDWYVYVEGHASRGEASLDGRKDAFELSAQRAMAVTQILIKRGIHPRKIITTFYGDTRPDEPYQTSSTTPAEQNRRVEFVLRQADLRVNGHKVSPY